MLVPVSLHIGKCMLLAFALHVITSRARECGSGIVSGCVRLSNCLSKHKLKYVKNVHTW